MDPFTITTSVLKITTTCLSTAKDLNDIRCQYRDAPIAIVAICSETTTISASLSHLQSLLLSKRDLEGILQARQDLAAALDTALIGCAVLFSCLNEETQRLSKGSTGPSTFSWKSRARMLWNHDKMKGLLDGLRGQQTAIQTLIQLLQIDSLAEIKQMLERNNDTFVQTAERTRSLREENPGIEAPTSIYGKDNREGSIYSTDISVNAPSELEFDFDDQIVNSKVYRRMLAQAMAKGNLGPTEIIEGDLIDFSDEATLKGRPAEEEDVTDGAAKLLEGLVMSNVDEVAARKEPEITNASQSELPIQHRETSSTGNLEAVLKHKFSFEIEPNSPLLQGDSPRPRSTSATLDPYTIKPQESSAATSPPPVSPNSPRPGTVIPEPPESSPPALSKSKSPQPSPKSKAVVRTCYRCGERLTGQFVRALDKTWHLQCFKCADCGQISASKFFPIDNDPEKASILCETDYFRRLDLLCNKCGQALKGSYITALDKKYHVDHFSCEICGEPFGAQESYYEHDSRVYCRYDYCLNFAELCTGCNAPITKQFVEIFRNGENQHWHPECYMIHKFWKVQVKKDSTYQRLESSWKDGNGVDVSRDQIDAWMDSVDEKVYKIWSRLSAFEEKSASWISNMLLHVSNGAIFDATQSAVGFLYAIEALFGSLNALIKTCLEQGEKAPVYQREAKLLCKKITSLFALMADRVQNPNRTARLVVTQELLTLVTGLAHYVKLLIRIGLQKSLRLQTDSDCFINQIAAQYLLDPPPNSMTAVRLQQLLPPVWDCYKCRKPVEGECYTKWIAVDRPDARLHDKCLHCDTCTQPGFAVDPELHQTMEGYFKGRLNCTNCDARRPPGVRFVNTLDLYMMLLWGALAYLVQDCQFQFANILKVGLPLKTTGWEPTGESKDSVPTTVKLQQVGKEVYPSTDSLSLEDIPRIVAQEQKKSDDPQSAAPLKKWADWTVGSKDNAQTGDNSGATTSAESPRYRSVVNKMRKERSKFTVTKLS